MPTHPSTYHFCVLAAAAMASVSIYLFPASLGMDVLKSYEVLADIYPEDMNDYTSRLTVEEKFQGELLRQLTDKIYLEQYSICAFILVLAILFLPLPIIVRRNCVLLVFLCLATPASIVLSGALATPLSLDRMLYPTWRDNIVVSWLVSYAVAFAVYLTPLPLLVLGWQRTSGGLIFRSETIQVPSGILLVVWLVGSTCSFFSGDYGAMLPLWLGFVFFYYVLPPSDEKTPTNKQMFQGLLERIPSV